MSPGIDPGITDLHCINRRGMKEDTDDFNKEVIEASFTKPVLVDFWAEWCGPCRVLGPVLERLAESNADTWNLVKVNTETHPDIAQKYNIRSIPNVKLFIDGEPVNEFVGTLPQPMIERWLKKNLPGRFDKDMDRAAELIEEGKTADASRSLEAILANEPGNHRARTLLSSLIFRSDPERALGMLEGIEEDSAYFETAQMLRTLSSLLQKSSGIVPLPDALIKDIYRAAIEDFKNEDYDAALGKFIYVVRNERYYDDDGARKACIAIFKYLGEEHPVTLAHRRDFGNALYI